VQARIAEIAGDLPASQRRVAELVVRGGVADGESGRTVLGVEPRSTRDVVEQLYRWESVAMVPVTHGRSGGRPGPRPGRRPGPAGETPA